MAILRRNLELSEMCGALATRQLCYTKYMSYIFLCKTKNNIEVVYDPVTSHAATHFDDAKQLKELTIEAIGLLDAVGDVIEKSIDLGRVIGGSDVVEVSANDEIVYAMRRNRYDDGLVPFVKNRAPSPCSTVAVHLRRDGERYILHSAWIGVIGGDDEPFPQSPDATSRSLSFWRKRAFVWGSQQIIAGSLTTKYPWGE